MIGWIKLHRSLKDWEWYQDANAIRLLIHLLVSVNYEPKKWKGIEIKAGELITSYENLGKELRLKRQPLRTALDKLEQSGEITRERTRHCLHLRLVKWEEMQHEQPDDNHKSNPTITREQPDDNLSVTPTKEVKKERILEEKKKEKEVRSTGVSTKPPEQPKVKRSIFIPPELIEVQNYCSERRNNVNPQQWHDHYTSNGWMVGKNKMKDWKAAVRTWEKNNYNKSNNGTTTAKGNQDWDAAASGWVNGSK